MIPDPDSSLSVITIKSARSTRNLGPEINHFSSNHPGVREDGSKVGTNTSNNHLASIFVLFTNSPSKGSLVLKEIICVKESESLEEVSDD